MIQFSQMKIRKYCSQSIMMSFLRWKREEIERRRNLEFLEKYLIELLQDHPENETQKENFKQEVKWVTDKIKELEKIGDTIKNYK